MQALELIIMEIIPLKIQKIIDDRDVVIFPVLIRIDGFNCLIDCGYVQTAEELLCALSSYHVNAGQLDAVIITHDDFDHLGGLAALKTQNPELEVICGKIEAASVSGKVKSERLLQAEESLKTMSEEMLPWALALIEKIKNVTRFEVNKTFDDEELFLNDLVIINTPGHTRGHISVFYSKSGTLICGDALVVENDVLDIANPVFTLDMKEALKSVEIIKHLHPQRLICYHGGIVENDIDKRLEEVLMRYA